MVKLISELRRRNVLRMVVLYLGAAWLVMQVVDVLIDRGPLPESLGPLMLIVLAIGFPIALILSWFYEVTPEGVTVDEGAESIASVPDSGRGLDFIVIAVLAAAVLLFAWDKWWTGPPPGRSVAVLPFADMSVDQDSAYFAAGVADSVLNMLAQVPDLHVASRTSSFQPRLEGLGAQEVADLLGVTTILEGSIQRQGDRLRITAQLINAQDDSHLWSRNFDRTDSDIFSIQDEIAEAVTSALETSLQGEVRQRIDREGTDNLEAFGEYSKAMENLRAATTDSILQAVEHLQRAVELDPGFARAHAMLGYVYRDWRYQEWSGLTGAETEDLAREAARTALRIAPRFSTAQTILGRVTDDVDAKGELLREAVANGPNDTIALRAYSDYLMDHFQTNEAMELAEELIRLDPLDENNYARLALHQWSLGRCHESLQTVARGEEKVPESVLLRDAAYNCHSVLGDYSSAIRVKHETLAIDPKEYVNRWLIAQEYFNVGMPEEAGLWFERATETAPEQLRDIMNLMRRTTLDVYYQRNDEEVFESLRRWVTERGGWGFPGVIVSPRSVYIEYGDRLGRLDDVLSTFESLAPHLFTDPPDMEKTIGWTNAVGSVLLRTGDRQNGEPMIRHVLEFQDRLATSGRDMALHANTFLYLGDTAAALDKFRALSADRILYGGLGPRFLVQNSPVWAPIRETPEFAALMEELDRNAAEHREKLRAMDLPVL